MKRSTRPAGPPAFLVSPITGAFVSVAALVIAMASAAILEFIETFTFQPTPPPWQWDVAAICEGYTTLAMLPVLLLAWLRAHALGRATLRSLDVALAIVLTCFCVELGIAAAGAFHETVLPALHERDALRPLPAPARR